MTPAVCVKVKREHVVDRADKKELSEKDSADGHKAGWRGHMPKRCLPGMLGKHGQRSVNNSVPHGFERGDKLRGAYLIQWAAHGQPASIQHIGRPDRLGHRGRQGG